MGRNGMGVAFGPADSARPGSTGGNTLEALGGLVDEVIEAEFRIGLAMSRRTKAIERARKYSEALANDPTSGKPSLSSIDMSRRAFVCEIAAALHIPDRTAERLIHTSQSLVNDLPATLLALGEGRLSFRHAQILVDNSYGLEREAVRELETRMLPVAQKNTPSRFEQSVRKTRERLNPQSIVERQVKAVAERCTELVPEQDGMVFVGAHVGAAVGVAIDNRLTDLARSLQCDGETRTLAQLKSDIFTDILLDVDGQSGTTAGHDAHPIARFRSIRPTVLVTVPAMTLLKRSNEPGIVEGYGPIDPVTAREIASSSKTMRRLITDPATGIVLAFDRKRYRIPNDLRTWLRVRDGTCRFPGCNRRAGPCEIDHTLDWALDGATNHDNLAHLCKRHHTIKGASDWAVEQLGGGRLRWTSPARIPYETEPETIMDAPHDLTVTADVTVTADLTVTAD
ncbi:MAG TPA: DUF222 domain-containing protein, partial [Galbitalea sp.]